jgi:two-component system response regulator
MMNHDAIIDILLVEDREDDISFFLHASREANPNAQITVARDGVEALAILFGDRDPAEAAPITRPKVIVLDLKLPKINGLEVLRRLKANPQTETIPIVILSSSKEKTDVIESYHLGVNSYLVKPMDFDEFTELVQVLGHYWLRFNQTPKA